MLTPKGNRAIITSTTTQRDNEMLTLTTTEQITLNILDARNSVEVENIQSQLCNHFINKTLPKLTIKLLRESLTEKLKGFGYKACGGNGR